MIYLNSGPRPVAVEVPLNDWVQAGEVVLSTDVRLPPAPRSRPATASPGSRSA